MPLGVTLVDLPGLFDLAQAKSSVTHGLIEKEQFDYIWVIGKAIDGTTFCVAVIHILDRIPVVLSEVAGIKSWSDVLLIRTHADTMVSLKIVKINATS